VKKLISISSLALVAAGLLAVTGVPDTPDLETVRYGGQYYPGEFLLKGAPEMWSTYGLDVEHTLFSSGTENNLALIAGNIDVNVGSDSKTVALFSALPDDAVILATIQRGDRYSTIVRADSPYQSWHDLKGKTVGTRLGTGAEQVLLRYFESTEDLAWGDFNWVNLGVEDMIAALAAGSIEAFTAWEPTPAIAESQGIGRSIRSFGDIALVPVSIHTTLMYVETHREELVRFLAAHLDKVALIQGDPEEAARIAAEAATAQGSEVSADAFLRIFQRVDFSMTFDESVLASIQDTAQFLFDQGKIDAVPTFRWDGSLLEEARTLRDESAGDEG
jgi:ABC-type nitrate/sulfonate/bicarbonate transport system substrate-binding protein